jgi:hypothetical protein
MDMKSFFKESAIPVENVKYVASERFRDEKGNQAEWELRPLTSEEFETILDGAKKKIPSPDNPRNMLIVTDQSKVRDEMLKAAIVEPNLKREDLQNSWGTVGEIATLRAMLLPGEVNDLANVIQQISGFEVGMEEKIKTIKN